MPCISRSSLRVSPNLGSVHSKSPWISSAVKYLESRPNRRTHRHAGTVEGVEGTHGRGCGCGCGPSMVWMKRFTKCFGRTPRSLVSSHLLNRTVIVISSNSNIQEPRGSLYTHYHGQGVGHTKRMLLVCLSWPRHLCPRPSDRCCCLVSKAVLVKPILKTCNRNLSIQEHGNKTHLQEIQSFGVKAMVPCRCSLKPIH